MRKLLIIGAFLAGMAGALGFYLAHKDEPEPDEPAGGPGEIEDEEDHEAKLEELAERTARKVHERIEAGNTEPPPKGGTPPEEEDPEELDE
jgi:hypothetical protein